MMRSSARLAALLLALLPACSSVAGAPVGEVAELLTMGRGRPLREPMHPIRGGTRVLVFALDGVGDDDLRRAIGEGRMPAVAGLLGAAQGRDLFAHGYASPGALSVLPSATTPGWAATFTGEPPARNGVPGNEWFDRRAVDFHAPVPMSVRSREDATTVYTDELMSDLLGAPTVWEGLRVRVHVSVSPFFRGADLLTIPQLASFGDLFEETIEGLLGGGAAANPGVARETDQSSVRTLVSAVEAYGLPDVQVVYLPGTDLLTHQAEDPLAAQQRYLSEVTDPAVGRVLELYRERGALDDSYVLFLSDHGHTPVLADERQSLAAGPGGPRALVEAAGFRLRPASLSADRDDFQAVLAYQGAMAFVYLADRSTCPAEGERCDWARAPRLEEDVLPVARALHAAGATGAGDPGMRGALDLVLARGAGSPDGEWGPFRVFDGRSLLPVAEYLRRHPRPDLLDLERRLHDLAVGPYGDRAGDLLLLARSGAHRPIEERFYFAPPERSEHGSAHAQDSRIPLLLAHPRRSGAQLRALLRDAAGEAPHQTGIAALIRRLVGDES